MLTVAVVLLVLVLALLLLLLLRRGPGEAVRQSLDDMRARIDQLAGSQQVLPRAMSEQVTALSTQLTRQLQAADASVGRRLDETGRAVADVRERLGQLAEATRRLEAVGASITQVQELLRVPRLRGTLGEVWLEELLRQVFPAGLFEMQYTFRSGLRVDAVIRIGPRLVPIDAKFPLEACQRMLAAEDGDAEQRERRAFRRSLRGRIDEIADKYICPAEGTFDFALMYVPAENVYYETVVRDDRPEEGDSLLAYAMSRKVIPVSPHTFYAYLSAVLHGLKGLQVEERARELQGELARLQQLTLQFAGSFDKIGTHLQHAQRAWDAAAKERERLAARLETLTGLRLEDGSTESAGSGS